MHRTNKIEAWMHERGEMERFQQYDDGNIQNIRYVLAYEEGI